MVYGKRFLWLIAATILAVGVFYIINGPLKSIAGFDASYPAFFISLAMSWLTMFVANLPSWGLLRLAKFPNSKNVTVVAGLLAYPLLYVITPLVFNISWFLGAIIAIALSYILADQCFNRADIPENKRQLMLVAIFIAVLLLFGFQILF